MSLSQAGLQAALAQSTDQCFLECLVFSHPAMTETMRLVNNTQNITRNSGEYFRANFEVIGMNQDEGQLPQMRIKVANIDQRLITEVRKLSGTRVDIECVYDVVLADTPDVIEYGPIQFRVDSVGNALQALDLNLSFRSGFLNAAFPHLQFAPSNRGS